MVHENLRARARRKAYHALKLGLDVNRRAPTDAETRAFVDAVDQGSVARFGVVKLSKLRLDDPVPTPAWLARARGWTLRRGITLIQLAALRRRDDIVCQLVRAGACPFERGDDRDHDAVGGDRAPDDAHPPDPDDIDPDALARDVRAFLSRVRSPQAAWLVVVAAEARRRAVVADAADDANASNDHPSIRDATSASTRDATSASFLYRCGHREPERRAWRRLVRRHHHPRATRPTCAAEWTCPTCGAVEEDERDDPAVPHPDPDVDANLDAPFLHANPGEPFLHKTPERFAALELADASRRRWLACAVETSRRKQKPEGDRRFRATGPRGCARANLGESRPKRVETLLAAAAEDDARRVFATVRAGVDVDASDEYGMTALATAAWRGNASAAAALLRCGADPRRAARGGEGVDAARAARAAGRTRLAEMLEDEARARDGAEEAGAEAVADADAGSGSGADVGDAGSGSGADVGDAGSGSGADGNAGSGSGADGNAGLGSGADGAAAPKTSPQSPRVRVLVDPSSNHPGARGSFYVDGAVPESILRRLERVGAAAAKERDADAAAVAVGRLKDLRSDAANRTRADTCADRAHFCDVEGWARRAIVAAARAGGMRANGAHPQMRVLRYDAPGGIMAPHVDLSKLVHPQDVAWTKAEQEEKRRDGGDVRMSVASQDRDEDGDEDGDGDDAEVLDEDDAEVGSEVGSTHTFILYLVTCASGGETALLADARVPSGAEGAAGAEALADVQPVRGRLLVFPHDCPHAGRPVADAPKVVVRGELW